MKSLSFLKYFFSLVLLGAFAFACNAPSSDGKNGEKKDVVSEDVGNKVDATNFDSKKE